MDATQIPDEASIASREAELNKALDEIGNALREQGLTLEDTIERGREIRGQLLAELYGIAGSDEPDRWPERAQPQ